MQAIISMIIMLFLLIGNSSSLFSQGKIEQLIEEALRNNPEYLSAKNRTASVNVQISQADALPDPQLKFAVANLPINSFTFDQEPMTGKKISLMQMFPFPGKLGLKEDIAEYQALITEQQVQELKNNLIKNVKILYFDLFFVDTSIEIVTKIKYCSSSLLKLLRQNIQLERDCSRMY